MIIREMIKDDINEALEIWKKAFNAGFSAGFDTYEVIERYLERNSGFSTVAVEDDESSKFHSRIVGALLCGHDGRRGSIYHTAVIPEMRGHEIGKKMQERATKELSKIGIHSGFLFINVKNIGSREFWESVGWKVIEDIKYMYKEF